MPTIQLKLSDAEFKQLLDLAHEATGIKAARYILSEYPRTLNTIYELETKVRDLDTEIDSLKYYINDFSVCLRQFDKVSKAYQEGDD